MPRLFVLFVCLLACYCCKQTKRKRRKKRNLTAYFSYLIYSRQIIIRYFTTASFNFVSRRSMGVFILSFLILWKFFIIDCKCTFNKRFFNGISKAFSYSVALLWFIALWSSLLIYVCYNIFALCYVKNTFDTI